MNPVDTDIETHRLFGQKSVGGEAPGIASTLEYVNSPAADTDKIAMGLAALADLPPIVPCTEAAQADRSKEIFRLRRDPETYEVTVDSDITLNDYRSMTLPEDWATLETYAKHMEGKTVVFINPTMEGGGVAMLRPPLVHMLRMFGVDARWYVMEGRKQPEDPDPFLFTKLMHNIAQRRMPESVRISDDGKSIHQQWNADNAQVLTRQNAIQNADVVFIDDPQPAPLMSHIKSANPNAKVVWRNHIDVDGSLMADPTTPQGELASYIFGDCGIGDADAMITHPVGSFVHPHYDHKTYFAPATIELHDDLNKPLDEQEIREGIAFINGEIMAKNAELEAKGRLADMQELIDTTRKRIVLVARFDESKGMDKAMKLGMLTRQKLADAGMPEDQLPQIIIVGNGSVDDPSGTPMYEEMLKLRREQYYSDRKNIVVMRLKHNYQAMNALMYESQDRDRPDESQIVAMQTSDAEGCETRISDWMIHGVPVVVSNRGGMSLQVQEGITGLVLDFDKPDHDLPRGAEYISSLLRDPALYAEVRDSTFRLAAMHNKRDFVTVANVTRLLRVFEHVLTGQAADKRWKFSDIGPQETLASAP